MAHYPADTFQEATEIAIEASNQLHGVINGDADAEVTVEDGSKIPSVRKAMVDSLYFKPPIAWAQGEYEDTYNQLREFVDGDVRTWWFAKGATVSTPVLMTTNPAIDVNWTLWSAVTLNAATYETQKRLAAEAGLNMVGSFLLGATVTNVGDVVFCETDGKYYGWGGTLPKTVPAGATPETTGGIGAGAWVDRTDVNLRQELTSSGSTVGDIAALKANLALPSGSGLSGFSRIPLVTKADNVGEMLSTADISPWEFADLITSKPTQSDPATWDWFPALSAAMTQAETTGQCVQLPPLKMKTSQTVVIPKGIIVRGCGGGGYIMEVQDQAAWRTVLIKTNGDVGGISVVSLLDGAQLHNVQVSPEFPDLVLYDTANYPAGTNNCSIGVTMGEGCYLQNVTAVGFAYCGFELDFVTKCVSCYAFKCQYGFLAKENHGDASLVECVGMFCHEAGAWLRSGYWKVLGGRWEWNARHGVILGSSGMVVGATFDRNGWAGVFIPYNMEGNTITGNVFRRNGCGGDGAFGRAGWHTPGDDGYVTTEDVNSCHIRWDGQRRTVISGNYYGAGKDDSGQGASSPKHVYTTGFASPVDGINTIGNHGDRKESDGGYAPDYNGGGASVWGGADANLTAYYGRRGTYLANGMRSDFFGGGAPVTSTAVSSLIVYVPSRTSGKILLRCSTFNQAKLAEVAFSCSSLNDTFTTQITNIIGAPVTIAAMANSNADTNKIGLTFDSAYYVTSTVICA